MSRPDEEGSSRWERRFLSGRTREQRQADSRKGVDRHGRPLPSVLRQTFRAGDYRCYVCGLTVEPPPVEVGERDGCVIRFHPAELRLLAHYDAKTDTWKPYAYRCRDTRACRERELAAQAAP